MDIYCKRCGEPWALPLEMTPQEERAFWRGEGCPCCLGKDPCPYPQACEECDKYGPGGCRWGYFKPINEEVRELQGLLEGYLGVMLVV